MINSGDSPFLILCDELNFTRAAERCFMTQQGLSAHIKKLEDQYKTKLFIRKPNVELTETGKALRLALLQKKRIEEDLTRTINEIDHGSIGKIHFGLNGTRATYLAPKILRNYCPKFEKVEIHFTIGDTERLIRELREGRIDGLLGVNAMPAPDLRVEILFREEIFLILKNNAICKNSEAKTEIHDHANPHSKRKNIRELSLKELAAPDGPIFARNEEGSTLNAMIDRILSEHNICLKTRAFISDYNVQLSLCKTLGFAVFCPESLVFADSGLSQDSELQVFRIKEIKDRMTISLVTDASRYYPESAKSFFRSVKDTLQEKAQHYLPLVRKANTHLHRRL